jgi:hypothetical protein
LRLYHLSSRLLARSFRAEYVDESKLDKVCAETVPLKISTILKKTELDSWGGAAQTLDGEPRPSPAAVCRAMRLCWAS